MRIKFVNTEADLFTSTGTMDTVVFNLINKEYFKPIELEYIHKHKRQKSIVLISSHQLEDFQAMSISHNSLFYLLTFEFPSTFTWYTVMTFQDSSQMNMNKILFDENGLAIEDYNMHGYEIVTASMDWMPFNAHKNCNPKGRKCQHSGLLVDQMNIWGKRYNFTWDVMTAYGNDWGLYPKSGILLVHLLNHKNVQICENWNQLYSLGPFNMSGNWTGVMGDVITGKYPMSVSSWLWLLERDPLLDCVPVLTDNDILVMTPNSPLFDLHLYIRPFRWALTYVGIFLNH